MQIVTITVQTEANNPVQGTAISIYNLAGQFITSATTDNTGLASISLPENTYTSYYYKQGVIIAQPVRLVVSSDSKNFLIRATVRTYIASADNKLITVYGYINDITGAPVKNSKVIILPNLLNINNTGLTQIRSKTVTSDGDGWFEFTLLKGIKYEAKLDSYMDTLQVETANQESVNIKDLLFPLPIELTLSSNTLSFPLTEQQNTDLTYQLRHTDGTYKALNYVPWASINAEYSDPTIAEVHYINGSLLVVALKRGSTTVTFSRIVDTNYLWSPLPNFTAPTLTITIQ